MRVFGVLVTFDRPAELRESVAAVAQQTLPPDRLIIVNNFAKQPLSVNQLGDIGDLSITLVEAGDNLGPAGGIALGMSIALDSAQDDDAIIVLDDDDPLVDNAVIEDLSRAFTSSAQQPGKLGAIGLRGAVLNDRTGRLTLPPSSDEPVDVRYLKSDWAPLYSASAIRTVGPFRSDLFFGFDDLEMGARLVAGGYRVEQHRLGRQPAAAQVQPSRSFRRSPWRTYYTQRNLITILRYLGLNRAAIRTALLGGFAKPLVNLIAGPNRSIVQARMSARAVYDAARSRTGRTVEPSIAKFGTDQAAQADRGQEHLNVVDPGSLPVSPAREGLTVAIPTHNAADTIVEQLQAVAAALDRLDPATSSEIIVVDNRSSDDSVEVATQWAAATDIPVRFVSASERPGEPHARNVGWRAANYSSIAYCDADDVVEPTWARALFETLQSSSYATGPIKTDRLNAHTYASVRGSVFARSFRLGRVVPMAHGCNMGFQRLVLEQLGGFDEDFLIGCDAEIAVRAFDAGIDLAWNDRAEIQYRLRAPWRPMYLQGRSYGRARASLNERLRLIGLDTGDSVGAYARRCLWIARSLLPSVVSPARRAKLAWVSGQLVGEARSAVSRIAHVA